jgi:hypothetical protein|tara:strand:- start:11 stop:250 length:240 start_codon:yes stop_codon:yes gene_type:complete
MSNKSEYQIEREKKTAINKKAMASLTTEQLEVIKKLKEDLGSALSMLAETNDLYLSDIQKLDDGYHKLCNNFNLDHSYR